MFFSNRSIILFSLFITFFSFFFILCDEADSDWFLKPSSGDSQYIKLDDLTGIVSTMELFTTNISSDVYIKVLGNTGISPWLIDGSDWYFDLYLRSSVTDEWELVKSHGCDTFPSDTVPVIAGIPAELRMVVYYPTDFDTALSVDTFPDRDSLSCVDTVIYPESGVVEIDEELIKYSSKGYDGKLNDVERGYHDTIPAFHGIGAKVSFYSGMFKIPIVIAIDYTSSSTGSGGGMHPSRAHILMLSISEGKPPVAMVHLTKWYNMVTGDASGSYDEDGVIVSYQWDWEPDGIWDADGSYAQYNYSKEGDFVVRLKVTDNDGMFSIYSSPVTIIFPPPEKLDLFTNIYGLPIIVWIFVITAGIIIALFVLRSHRSDYAKKSSYPNFLSKKKIF
mgnify:CR=1 FL=1